MLHLYHRALTLTLTLTANLTLSDIRLRMQLDEREAALRAAQREVEQLRAQMAAWRASIGATEAAIRAEADAAAKRTVRHSSLFGGGTP